MNFVFTDDAWQDYLWWHSHDLVVWQKINGLIKECSRTPFQGTAKPEPLKNDLKGYWSRRITKEDRLVYTFNNERLLVLSCKGHYE